MSGCCLFLVCHAPLASALHAVACHGFGRSLSDVEVLDVLSSQGPDQVGQALESRWQELGKPKAVFFLTDMIGATPYNGVLSFMNSHPDIAQGVAGVSLPVLLRAITYRSLNQCELIAKLGEDTGHYLQTISPPPASG
ncbi:MAG: PTS sugar transporter subunit IIA [Burkholderiaceae bacterium]